MLSRSNHQRLASLSHSGRGFPLKRPGLLQLQQLVGLLAAALERPRVVRVFGLELGRVIVVKNLHRLRVIDVDAQRIFQLLLDLDRALKALSGRLGLLLQDDVVEAVHDVVVRKLPALKFPFRQNQVRHRRQVCPADAAPFVLWASESLSIRQKSIPASQSFHLSMKQFSLKNEFLKRL